MWISDPTPADAPLPERQYEKLYRLIDAQVNIPKPDLAMSCRDALDTGGKFSDQSSWHAWLTTESLKLIETLATRVLAEGEQGFLRLRTDASSAG